MKHLLRFTLALFLGCIATVNAQQNEKEKDSILNVSLEEVVVSSGVIDVAKERETPIALTTISAQEIESKIGNQEFVNIMQNSPGVYVNNEKGGYGDGQIYVRGFNQVNTSFLINGVPVNDMENGKVYWSNWMVLTDMTNQIQMQRGLGSSSLAVPSVGGTVSIFTKSSEMSKGGMLKQTVGNDGYSKTTIGYNSGVNEKGWSSSYLLAYWKGDGYVMGTEGEGYNYAATVGYTPSEQHKFNVTLVGAGQWHHQRDVDISIRDYEYFGESGIDRRWNSDYGTLNGETYNIERNFYNKPIGTFNWDWKISEKVALNTSVYASAGRGGGTGSRSRNYDVMPFRQDLYSFIVEDGNTEFRRADGTVNWDAIVRDNASGNYTGGLAGGAFDGLSVITHGGRGDGLKRDGFIRRSSMNSHDWYGGIMRLSAEAGNFTFNAGLDWRQYTGYHYQVLNDLLGADAFYQTYNRNLGNGLFVTQEQTASPFESTSLDGEKLNYFNIGYVDWLGFNGVVEYTSDDSNFNAVFQAGASNQTFQREDIFAYNFDQLSEKSSIPGGYVKGGANLNINEQNNVFFNAGYISRQPFFDAVFPNFGNNVNEDVENEKITSFELGYGFVTNALKVNLNLYSTVWGNRFISRGFTLDSGDSGTATFAGVEQTHSGLELEVKYRPTGSLTLEGMISAGNWRYTKDFNANIFDENQRNIGTETLYMKDVKVGGSGQFVSYLEADYRIADGFSVDLGLRTVSNLYAQFSLQDDAFSDPNNQGAVELPSFNLVDFGTTYRFDLGDNKMVARLNINNLFDTVYINQSLTNIHASASSDTWNGIDKQNFVLFGFGTTWNFSLSYRF